MKLCAYCGEAIQDDAVKCGRCKRTVSPKWLRWMAVIILIDFLLISIFALYTLASVVGWLSFALVLVLLWVCGKVFDDEAPWL